MRTDLGQEQLLLSQLRDAVYTWRQGLAALAGAAQSGFNIPMRLATDEAGAQVASILRTLCGGSWCHTAPLPEGPARIAVEYVRQSMSEQEAICSALVPLPHPLVPGWVQAHWPYYRRTYVGELERRFAPPHGANYYSAYTLYTGRAWGVRGLHSTAGPYALNALLSELAERDDWPEGVTWRASTHTLWASMFASRSFPTWEVRLRGRRLLHSVEDAHGTMMAQLCKRSDPSERTFMREASAVIQRLDDLTYGWVWGVLTARSLAFAALWGPATARRFGRPHYYGWWWDEDEWAAVAAHDGDHDG